MLAGRRINDYMPYWLVEQFILNLSKKGCTIRGTKVLILGLTFKENCPDFRNSKIFDLISGLEEYGLEIELFDPYINDSLRGKFKNYKFLESLDQCNKFKAVIVAVSHNIFKEFSLSKWHSLVESDGIIFDIKGIVPKDINPIRINFY